MAECRSCGAPGLWAVSEKTGKPILIEPVTVEGGNVMLLQRGDDPPLAHFTTKAEREKLVARGARLHVAHFTTCPDADNWRKQ